MADIVRMVEAAQARTAPIQRLADAVAGRFAYGVMGASLATFCFWATAGTSMFPQVHNKCHMTDAPWRMHQCDINRHIGCVCLGAC